MKERRFGVTLKKYIYAYLFGFRTNQKGLMNMGKSLNGTVEQKMKYRCLKMAEYKEELLRWNSTRKSLSNLW